MAGQRKVEVFSRATRAKTLPLTLSPVAVGGALAWNAGRPFAWGWFAVTLVGAGAMHLGANAWNDYVDERSGADKIARTERSSIATGSGVIDAGVMSARGVLTLSAVLFSVALACGVALALARGGIVFALGAIGFVLAWQYGAGPIKYGYRGRGLGELGIFASFGVLPVAGSFYVQAQRFEAVAWWGAVVPGLLTTVVIYHHHLLHWRADRAANKMTPVAVLGAETGLTVSAAAIVITYLALVVEIVLGVFPPYGAVALVTLFPLVASWSRARIDPAPQNILNLLGASLGASVVTGAILTAGLVVERVLL